MKVCHLISGDLWAGAEVQAYTMIKALKQTGEIELSAILLNPGNLENKLRELGVAVDLLDESKLSFFEILSSLKKIIRANPPDLIHSHRLKENVLAALTKRAGLVPGLVCTVHGLPEATGIKNRVKSRVLRAIEKTAIKRYFDRVLPVSKEIAGQLTPTYGPAMVTEVHNAIDLEALQLASSSQKIRESLGIRPDQIVIGTAGRMVPVKGYDRFLLAAKLILDSLPGAMFVLAGDGPLRIELEQKAAEMGLIDHVIFTGFREDILDLVNCFDLLLITSHHEGIPMIVLEAMALEKVVVAFNVGGLSEIIQPDISGLLVAPDDIAELAETCLRLLDDHVQRSDMALAARTRIQLEFSTEVQRKLLLEVYQQIGAGKPKRLT